MIFFASGSMNSLPGLYSDSVITRYYIALLFQHFCQIRDIFLCVFQSPQSTSIRIFLHTNQKRILFAHGFLRQYIQRRQHRY